ncbi:MAG: MurR/RpiR family transcriptional regulator [Mycoplasma sp.]|nr:MurR/RpiR family transcriptional regulator [Mycoplasma sp.]
MDNEKTNVKSFKKNYSNKNEFKIFDIDKISNLNESEKEMLEHINSNPVSFLDNNLIDCSKLFYSSKSSISRLSQKLGFKYLIDMKLYIRGKIAVNELYDVTNGNDTVSIVNNLKAYNIFGINETLINIDIDTIKNVCKEITKAKRVISFGIGSSYLPAYEFSCNLLRLGINSASTNDIHNFLLIISSSNKNETVVVFSKSARNKEILYILDVCKEIGINVVLITNNSEDNLDVKFKILINDIEKSKRLIATSSKISMLVIGDLIYHELFRMGKNYDVYLKKSKELLDRWKKFKIDK